MDEPLLYLRDGASMLTIPLSEVLEIEDEASRLAADAHRGDASAVKAAELITERAQAYGPHRPRARLFAFFIERAWQRIEETKMRSVVTVAGEVTSEESGAAPPAAAPPASAVGPCNHPPDVACPACVGAHQEARNARKRERARA